MRMQQVSRLVCILNPSWIGGDLVGVIGLSLLPPLSIPAAVQTATSWATPATLLLSLHCCRLQLTC